MAELGGEVDVVRCTTSEWCVQLLNGMRVRRRGHEIALTTAAARLVALVALRGGGPRSAVAATLWPESREGQAQANLRTALWRLHRAAPGLLAGAAGDVALTAGVEVDVAVLVAGARRLAEPIDDIESDPPLPAGELLPGWFEDWVLLERDRIRQWRLHALESLAVRQSAVGRHAEAMATAYEAISADPLRESARRVLIGVHLAEGNVVEARRQFAAFRALHVAELGVEPSPLLRFPVGLRESGGPRRLPAPDPVDSRRAASR